MIKVDWRVNKLIKLKLSSCSTQTNKIDTRRSLDNHRRIERLFKLFTRPL